MFECVLIHCAPSFWASTCVALECATVLCAVCYELLCCTCLYMNGVLKNSVYCVHVACGVCLFCLFSVAIVSILCAWVFIVCYELLYGVFRSCLLSGKSCCVVLICTVCCICFYGECVVHCYGVCCSSLLQSYLASLRALHYGLPTTSRLCILCRLICKKSPIEYGSFA